MKIKKMPLDQYQEVLGREWLPVQLFEDAIPDWAKTIPKEILGAIFASGTRSVSGIASYQSQLIPSGELIGGFDVYRKAPDDPVEFNKDWYAVVRCEDDPTILLVDGPFKDAEHWLDEIPKRLNGVEVFGVPKPIPNEGP